MLGVNDISTVQNSKSPFVSFIPSSLRIIDEATVLVGLKIKIHNISDDI